MHGLRTIGRQWETISEMMGKTKNREQVRHHSRLLYKHILKNPNLDFADIKPILEDIHDVKQPAGIMS